MQAILQCVLTVVGVDINRIVSDETNTCISNDLLHKAKTVKYPLVLCEAHN